MVAQKIIVGGAAGRYWRGTYFAGSQIGALEFGHSWSLAAISLQWSIAMPLLIWFAQRHSETGLSHLNYNNSANN